VTNRRESDASRDITFLVIARTERLHTFH
jgi:hypothetical protein